MSAILGRIYDDGNGVAYEYLALVPATADAGDSWRWTKFKSEAHWFHFKSHEDEERTLEAHTCEIRGKRVRPWAVNGTPPDWAKEKRDVAAATTHSASSGQAHSASSGQVPAKGIAPMTGAPIAQRIKTAKVNRKVAAQRKAAKTPTSVVRVPRENGANAWKAVFENRVSPQESFEETERRCGS